MITILVTPGKPSGVGARAGRPQLDTAAATWGQNRHTVVHRSATAALCRELVRAGCPDQPWESRLPDGARSLFGPSVHAWALEEFEPPAAWKRP